MIALLVLLAGMPIVGTLEFHLVDEAIEGWGVLQWPVLAGEADVVDQINSALDYETLLGEPIAETAEYYREYERGIVSSGFEVNYMDEDYFDISIYWEFVGAYPSGNEISMLFSLEDGSRVSPNDLFLVDNLDELVYLCEKKLQENILQKISEDPPLYEDFYDHHFTADDLGSVGIRENGIHFEFMFYYPHAILAAEPSGDIFFTWDEIREFLLPGVARI